MNNKEIMNIIDIIDDLNIEYYDKTGDDELLPFSVTIANGIIVLSFLNQQFWDSENNSIYDDNDNVIDLKREIIIIIKEIIQNMNIFLKGC